MDKISVIASLITDDPNVLSEVELPRHKQTLFTKKQLQDRSEVEKLPDEWLDRVADAINTLVYAKKQGIVSDEQFAKLGDWLRGGGLGAAPKIY